MTRDDEDLYTNRTLLLALAVNVVVGFPVALLVYLAAYGQAFAPNAPVSIVEAWGQLGAPVLAVVGAFLLGYPLSYGLVLAYLRRNGTARDGDG